MWILLKNSNFLGNLNVHNLCHKTASSNRDVEEIQSWKVKLRDTGWEKRKGFDFRELKVKQSQRNSPKCRYNSCINKSDCVLCWDNCHDREARKPFYIFFLKFWDKVLLQAWTNDLWMWLEDGGRLWMCLTIRSMRKMYLCSGACWIRGRIKYVTEKAAELSSCLGFQQLCWDMAKYKMVWICWGEGWPRGF